MPTKPRKNKPVGAKPDDVGRGLLAQALESDEARLVYADWLEQQGHPFADVIRLQLADTSAQAVIDRHRLAWITPLGSWVDDPVFERGMLRRVYGKAGAYAQQATQAALLPAASTFGIHKTHLRGPSKKLGGAATLAWTPELCWWDCQLDDAQLAELAGSPHLAQLSSLTLEKVRAGNPGLAALATLSRLRYLALPAPVHLGNFTASGILELLDRVPITSLALTGVNNLDLDTLVASPKVARLTWLSVATRHVRAVAASPHLTSLTTLRISSIDRVADADVEPLLDHPTLTSVYLKLWSPNQPTKPTPAMIARLRTRFGEGFTYETSGVPGIV